MGIMAHQDIRFATKSAKVIACRIMFAAWIIDTFIGKESLQLCDTGKCDTVKTQLTASGEFHCFY